MSKCIENISKLSVFFFNQNILIFNFFILMIFNFEINSIIIKLFKICL